MMFVYFDWFEFIMLLMICTALYKVSGSCFEFVYSNRRCTSDVLLRGVHVTLFCTPPSYRLVMFLFLYKNGFIRRLKLEGIGMH